MGGGAKLRRFRGVSLSESLTAGIGKRRTVMKTIPVSLVLASSLATAFAQSGVVEPQGPPPPEERPELGPGPRGGPGRGQPWAELLKRADTNQDGAISREEFLSLERVSKLPEEKREKIFTRLDKDQNGTLSKEEIAGMRRGPGRKGLPKLEELDTDRSGGVSFEEFKASSFVQKIPVERQEGLFKRLDSDGDGQITPKDRPEPSPHDGRGFFKRLDANDDAALSFEEFQKAPFVAGRSEDEQEKKFQELDRNGDKKLTEDEMPRPPRGPRREGPPKPTEPAPEGPPPAP
jgi:Ca2+-binding EF-hand superfamily protein